MLNKPKSMAFALGVMLLCLTPAFGKSIVPINLVDLTNLSVRIFEGRCIKVERVTVKGRHGKLDIPAVRYTFEVLDNLKGIEGKQVAITQLGHAAPGEQEFMVDPDWVGLPKYRAGETYMLFMNKNFMTGLTSPVGVAQGVFGIKDGLANNLEGNAHILKGMEKAISAAGYADLLPVSATGAANKAVAYQGMDAVRLKGLVRDLMSGKVKAPSQKEMPK